ncbi:MAG: hypothetical protein BRC40_16820 [Cyanobacteria bacterium QH_8_48_120]|nr:MAG: hypothetical protein BRC40_16820 [Cyanobacteria bacterium QH_8_48_120]
MGKESGKTSYIEKLFFVLLFKQNSMFILSLAQTTSCSSHEIVYRIDELINSLFASASERSHMIILRTIRRFFCEMVDVDRFTCLSIWCVDATMPMPGRLIGGEHNHAIEGGQNCDLF